MVAGPTVDGVGPALEVVDAGTDEDDESVGGAGRTDVDGVVTSESTAVEGEVARPWGSELGADRREPSTVTVGPTGAGAPTATSPPSSPPPTPPPTPSPTPVTARGNASAIGAVAGDDGSGVGAPAAGGASEMVAVPDAVDVGNADEAETRLGVSPTSSGPRTTMPTTTSTTATTPSNHGRAEGRRAAGPAVGPGGVVDPWPKSRFRTGDGPNWELPPPAAGPNGWMCRESRSGSAARSATEPMTRERRSASGAWATTRRRYGAIGSTDMDEVELRLG